MILQKLLLITTIFLFANVLCYAQNDNKSKDAFDATGLEGPEYKMTIRAGLGIQKSFFAEIGGGLRRINKTETSFNSQGIYAAFEYVPTIGHFDNRDVFGWKLGYEMNIKMLALGLEGKYQTRKGINDFVITPRIGLNFFNAVNLLYGYNISTNGRPFDEVGMHQFSLIFNISPGMITAAKPSGKK